MSIVWRTLAALALAGCVSGCSSNPDEVALEDACGALTSADWSALDVAVDEVSSEYGDEVGLDDFHAVIDGSRAEQFALSGDDYPALELRGREGAVDFVRDGFEGAWTTCSDRFDDTPPANGDAFEAAWGELGSGLFYLFGTS